MCRNVNYLWANLQLYYVTFFKLGYSDCTFSKLVAMFVCNQFLNLVNNLQLFFLLFCGMFLLFFLCVYFEILLCSSVDIFS